MIPSVRDLMIEELVEEVGPVLLGALEGAVREAQANGCRHFRFGYGAYATRRHMAAKNLLEQQGYTVDAESAEDEGYSEWRVTWP